MGSPEPQTETASPSAAPDGSGEVELLRERVAALEAELAEVQARSNAAIAVAQEGAYWLDRWHLDLNALMRRRWAAELRSLVRVVRAAFRLVRKARRSLKK
jgi:hypothetical protein